MALLDDLLGAIAALLDVAESNRATLVVAYTHGQPAQPTTYGHYLGALVELLLRDVERLRQASRYPDLSSMGAAAITTSGFPLDRAAMAELLGFAEVQENAYGCIAANDYLTSVYGALQLVFVHLGRFAQDLNAWTAFEVGHLHVPDAYVQVSSIMPQKRNPVAVEHLQTPLLARRRAGPASTLDGAAQHAVHRRERRRGRGPGGRLRGVRRRGAERSGSSRGSSARRAWTRRACAATSTRAASRPPSWPTRWCARRASRSARRTRSSPRLVRGMLGRGERFPTVPVRGLRPTRSPGSPAARPGSGKRISAATRRPSTSSRCARCRAARRRARSGRASRRYRSELDAARSWLDGYRARHRGRRPPAGRRARDLIEGVGSFGSG